MSEVPHCPGCGRADTVSVRRGPGYEYYCNNPPCQTVFDADAVTDVAWIDMVSNSMFDDTESAIERATDDYNAECECQWCERGRPGLSKFDP